MKDRSYGLILVVLSVGLFLWSPACKSESDSEAGASEQTKEGESTSKNSGATSREQNVEEQKDESAEPTDKNPENEKNNQKADKTEGPSKDIYPGIPIGRLSAENRKTFVELAKGELCPCSGINESLHQCLQSKKKRCGVAKRVGALIAVSVKKGKSKTDIRDQIVKVVEAANKTYEFSLKDTPAKGPEDAPVKLVEFADFQCPHCRRVSNVLAEVRKDIGDKFRHYFKHFPLRTHPQARFAAKASIAAYRQDKFWPMHDLLFEHQRELSKKRINTFARQIGVNFNKFKKDLRAPQTMSIISRDKKEAKEAKVTSTPTIFINGKRYMGAKTEEALKRRIESAIKK